MKNVYLASVASKSGKSVLSLGLATNYPGKAGFYKPFRESLVQVGDELMDQDAVLMSEVLKISEGRKLSPFVYDFNEPIPMSRLTAGYHELCEDKEFMIIEGSRDPATGSAHKLSHIDIAKALNAPIVLVATPTRQSIDMMFLFKELCRQNKIKILGTVINRSSGLPERSFLEGHGIKVLGEIPEMSELKTFRVSEISDKMDAKVIAGGKGMENIVETMLVGAMSIQAALGYMRRTKRKAMITGGDRTEMLLAALSTDTSCIIVTGGIKPSHTVLSRADEIGVPVLMTTEDTLHVTEIIEHLIARIDPTDKDKIAHVRNVVRDNVDLNAIFGL
ncbi:MAG: phosphotransacetylase family protein [Methanomassiliicoccaceae archaeon]|nr:phosphotransacetylase family protein [Methanomassiliicoccaceae archaeon]